jgi:hypothetical protein
MHFPFTKLLCHSNNAGLVSPDLYASIVTVTIFAMLVHWNAATACDGPGMSGKKTK